MTWLRKYGNKFNNCKSDYNGILYDSKKEAARAQELDLLERAREIRNIKRQVKISFDICRRCKRLCSNVCPSCKEVSLAHISNYYIDFVYYDKKNKVEVYEEIKGFETQVWKDKWKLLTILYEDDPMKNLVVIK